MSELTEELDRKTILAWRTWAASPHFQKGLDWLRHNRKRASGSTPAELIDSAIGWSNYMDAVDDVQDRLTALPAKDDSLDEAPLNQ